MKIVKGDNVIEVTEKAFRVVYAHIGFTPYVEKKVATKKKVVKDNGTN